MLPVFLGPLLQLKVRFRNWHLGEFVRTRHFEVDSLRTRCKLPNRGTVGGPGGYPAGLEPTLTTLDSRKTNAASNKGKVNKRLIMLQFRIVLLEAT